MHSVSTLSGAGCESYNAVDGNEENNLSHLVLLQQMQPIGMTQLPCTVILNFITVVLTSK